MSYILSPERDEDCESAFTRYRAFLINEKERFPKNAFALATSDWYFGADDHRVPHDAWLLKAIVEETGESPRQKRRAVSLRLQLVGAYHDLELEFFYRRVYSYSFSPGLVEVGHGDWRYDEFRLSEQGHLLHEIQWCGIDNEATWVIEADDVEFSSKNHQAG